MSTTLTYGFKRPDTGDKGSVWFSDLEDNITRLDGHDHDGTDSAQLSNSGIAAGAAIAVNKLAALTASKAVTLDGSGFIQAATTTGAQLERLATLHEVADALTLTETTTPATPSSGEGRIYMKAGNTAYIIDSGGAEAQIQTSTTALFTGALVDYCGTTAPSGWVLGNGLTIGNAASSATERANADTEALFTLLWDSSADAQLSVSGGRGASAAADFAANKRIDLPDCRGRVIAGNDTMGSTSANRLAQQLNGDTMFITGGVEEHTLLTGESGVATHTHPTTGTAASNGAHTHIAPGDNGSGAGSNGYVMDKLVATAGTGGFATDSDGAHTHTTSGTASAPSTASAANPHTNVQPMIGMTKVIKL